MTEKLFVYGSLKDPAVQYRLSGRTIAGAPDEVRGFRRYVSLEYPVALPDTAHSVDGLVLTVTPEELALLDAYEGSTYLRIRVTLLSGTTAWMYQGDEAVYTPLLKDQS
jgi:gamma-glutamylcyclotransferase (GGCT)/AIG2-like uncharacterized protein YtfP